MLWLRYRMRESRRNMKMYEIAQQLDVTRQTADWGRRSMIRNLAWGM
ncbi:hypothetical protein [Aneurinibacillus aneurinilyticus]